MALSRILRKLRIIKPLPKQEPTNINKDSKAIIDFLVNLTHDQENLLRLFKNFLELRLEYRALTDPDLKLENLKHQVNIFDQIIKSYSFFQGDADINGERVKKISQALQKMAFKSEDLDIIDKTNQTHWKFDW